MSNRLRLAGILTPPADDAWRASTGYVRFDPADDTAAGWGVPGYKPAWPIIGVPNATGTGLMEVNGGALYVPGDEPGDSYAGPWMMVSYELQTNAGTWHRGKYLWRAVSTGGGSIDLRTPAPELEPPTVQRPGVPATALTTGDLSRLVEVTELDGMRGRPNGLATLNADGVVPAEQLGSYTLGNDNSIAYQRLGNMVLGFGRLTLGQINLVTFRGIIEYPYNINAARVNAMVYAPDLRVAGAEGVSATYGRELEVRINEINATNAVIDAYNLKSNNVEGDRVVVDVLLMGLYG